ncbi:hypothetical protein VTN00DRAFT_2021 [Thermoascus crustaceus]|uniref:uncharacterized protein n=1 Tax=Thermoascus crustaceus TaxID=5088 RepID=UPI003742D891
MDDCICVSMERRFCVFLFLRPIDLPVPSWLAGRLLSTTYPQLQWISNGRFCLSILSSLPPWIDIPVVFSCPVGSKYIAYLPSLHLLRGEDLWTDI